MTKQITTTDLSEQLLDVLNGMNAVISVLAEKAGLSHSQIKIIHMEASQRAQRAMAEAARIQAIRETFEEDNQAMAAWAHATRFDFDNAKDWEAAAAVEWACICERNGSEHGRNHTYKFKALTQDELMEGLQELQRWANSTEAHNAGLREHAINTLPKIKQKLAVMLSA